MSSAADVLALARRRGVMLATAESCTAGLISAALTEVAGASRSFDRGFVTYSNTAKEDLLGVLSVTLAGHGAVSEAVAAEMAEGALERSLAQLAIAVTGIAGPGGGSAEKPEGRVCFGLAETGRETLTQTVDFGALGRTAVRAATVDHALRLLADRLAD